MLFCLKKHLWGLVMTAEKEEIDEELERLNNKLDEMTINFVRAVEKMAKEGSFPVVIQEGVFPYALELINYTLSRDFANRGKGIVAFLNPRCGEDVIMARAIAIEHALEACNIGFFQEWQDWQKAVDDVEQYSLKKWKKRKD